MLFRLPISYLRYAVYMKILPFLLPFFFVCTAVQAQNTHTVDVTGIAFSPAHLDVTVGDTVDFVWGSGVHNVRALSGAFDSGSPVAGPLTFSVTFDQQFLNDNPFSNNFYKYQCDIHIAIGMAGSIKVVTPGIPVLDLAPDLPAAGSPLTFHVWDASPNSTVMLGYSMTGGGPFNSPFGLALLTPPVKLVSSMNADSAGHASLSVTVPASMQGRSIWFQALDRTATVFSNGVFSVFN